MRDRLEFEVDLFEHGIVVEVATYVRREETDKLERLLRIRAFSKRELKKEDLQFFLVCMPIDRAIFKKSRLANRGHCNSKTRKWNRDLERSAKLLSLHH